MMVLRTCGEKKSDPKISTKIADNSGLLYGHIHWLGASNNELAFSCNTESA